MNEVTPTLNSHQTRRSAYHSAMYVGTIVALLGVIGCTFFVRAIARQNDVDFALRQNQQANIIQNSAADALFNYNRLLTAAGTTVRLNPNITRAEWHSFYESMEVSTAFPELLGVGYVTTLKPDQISSFQDSIRAQGLPDFTVNPETPRDFYTAITYLEPLNETNAKAEGYDMFSEETRRHAMERARDTGESSMSAPVHLVQDDADNSRRGVLIYRPVYEGGEIPNTVEERRVRLKGYTYAVVRPVDMFRSFMADTDEIARNTDVIITDVTEKRHHKVFDVDNSKSEPDQQFSSSREIMANGRKWDLTVAGQNNSFVRLIGPGSILALGTFASLVVGFIVFWALRSRIESVEKTYDLEVQRTKDELLALASHQLRTPASGVKQYLGMLTQGFLGQLTDKQKEVATKAYEANERQLEIINELLYVSKADAGQLMIEPTDTDLTEMTRKVIDSFEQRAANKKIDLVYQNITPRHVSIDPRYGSMIIENLVSNAIKYSNPDTKVIIRLKDIGKNVGLSVTDQGVGIAEEDLDKIFGKFDRVSNPLSSSEGGSGLGLFLAMELAKAHSGTINVESKLHSGSTFTLLLPKKSLVDHATVDLRKKRKKRKR